MKPAMTFYFGLRSPYAWLARRLLCTHLAAADLEQIELVPYWDPAPGTAAALRDAGGEFLYRPMSKRRHLYILQDIKRLTSNAGADLNWPLDRPGACWEPAHLACLIAAHAGRQAEAVDRLFAARWERGVDLCDPASLATELATAGLGDPAQLSDSDARALQAEAATVQLRCFRAGVFGLPYFTVGREAFWGIDRLPAAVARAGLDAEPVLNGCMTLLAGMPHAPTPSQLREAS